VFVFFLQVAEPTPYFVPDSASEVSIGLLVVENCISGGVRGVHQETAEEEAGRARLMGLN
jgi:hypothetical protein